MRRADRGPGRERLDGAMTEVLLGSAPDGWEWGCATARAGAEVPPLPFLGEEWGYILSGRVRFTRFPKHDAPPTGPEEHVLVGGDAFRLSAGDRVLMEVLDALAFLFCRTPTQSRPPAAAEPPAVSLRSVTPADREWILELVRDSGADFIVSRERKLFPAELPGFVALDAAGERVGLATYQVTGHQCELVLLRAVRRGQGIGTLLVAAAGEAAVRAGCRRLWLITTNDNTDALRFYQRRGFQLVAVHRGLRDRARELKPQIPEYGDNGIAIRDEIELEALLER